METILLVITMISLVPISYYFPLSTFKWYRKYKKGNWYKIKIQSNSYWVREVYNNETLLKEDYGN